MRAHVAHAARLLARAREWLPITNLGLAVLGLAAATYWGFAKPRADYALGLVGQLAMGLVGLAVVGVLLGAALLVRRLRRLPDPGSPLYFEAVRGFARGLEMPSWRALPMLEVRWTWRAPEGLDLELERGGGHIREALAAPARVRAERVRRRFVVEDGFGLARWVHHHEEVRSVRVLPYLGRLDQAPLLQSLASGDDLPHPRGRPDGDRVDMRRYVPGDPLRLALWKVYARTRQLMVRSPERALSPSLRVVAYLVSAPGDEPAAAAARWAVERGVLGEQWTFGADGATHEAQDAATALDQIVDARAARGTDRGEAAGLSPFLDTHDALDHARVVLFLPGRPGPWLDRVAGVLRARRREVTCVVGIDGVAPEAPTPPLLTRAQTWLRQPEGPDVAAEAVVAPDELSRVTQRLLASGAQVVALDRRAGRVLPVGARGAMDLAYREGPRGGRAA